MQFSIIPNSNLEPCFACGKDSETTIAVEDWTEESVKTISFCSDCQKQLLQLLNKWSQV